MDKYNFDFNKIIDKSNKKYFEKIKENLSKVTIFGIAKNKMQLDRESIKCLGEEYSKVTGIFVPMDYYSLTFNEDNAFTLGIGSCCGLVIFNGNFKFLMHISPKCSFDNILALLSTLNILYDGEAYIFPGSACEYEKNGNKMNYNQLANELKKFGNNVYIRKFNSISGSVYLLNGNLIIIDDKPIEIKDFENSTGIKK